MVRHGRKRWFEHLERKGADDWGSVCRNVGGGGGGRCVGRGRKTWGECVKDDMILFGLYHCSLNDLVGLSVPNKHAHKFDCALYSSMIS